MAKKQLEYVLPSPTDVLPELWEAGVFKTERTVAEVISEFAKREYNFSHAAVSMTLMRAKFLTRRGSKGTFKYIQVGPFRRAA